MMLAIALNGCGDGKKSRDTVAVATPTAPPIMPPPVVRDRPAAGTAAVDGWVGKWVGVEGLALAVAKGDAPATYRLHVALMDGANDYVGRAEGDTIRFERDGRTETIRHGTGEETGLKWLAGKRDCLIIREAEGFCRD